MEDDIKNITNERKNQLKIVSELESKGDALTKQDQTQLKIEQKKLSFIEKQLEKKKLNLKITQDEAKESNSFLQSYIKLNDKIQKQLAGQSKSGSVYLGIGRQIAKEKAREQRYEESSTKFAKKQKQDIQDRLNILGDINNELLSQAKSTQNAQDTLKGITPLEKELRDFREASVDFTKEQKRLGEEAIRQKNILLKKEEQIEAIQDAQKELLQSLPQEFQTIITNVKQFSGAIGSGLLPIIAIAGLVTATISSFIDLSAAAEDFRVETGLTRSQTEGLEKSINNVVASTAKLGVNADEVSKAASSFATQFQNTQVPSEEVLENIVVLNKNFGVSIDNLTEVNKLFTTLSGVSADTAQFMTSTVVEAANLAKVSPNQVIEDLSKNAEAAFTFFDGSVEALSAAAIEAAKLGTSIEQAAEVSKGLLNFESSITSELEASAILGRNINFNDARRLAASGEILEAQKAVLDEVSKLGDITKLNVFEQEALADAAGMPIQDLVFQQKIRNNLGELGKEELDLAMKQLKAGTDISDISKEQLQNQTDQLSKQQEIQSEVNQLKNAFMGVVAEVGSVLTPLLLDLIPVMKAILAPVKLMVDGFSVISTFLRENIGLAKVLGTIVAGIAGYQTVIVGKQIASLAITKTKSILESGYLRILYLQDALQKKNLLKSIGQMASNAFISASKTPFIGPLLGAAAAASAFALGMSYFSKADDLMSMPSGYGNRVLSSPEGTFALNNNDTVVAGTNLGIGNNKTPNNNLGFREEQPFQTTNILETNLSNENNMEVLSAPLNIMINEIKSLRQDIRNRKNEVYLDGKKVTAQISRQVDRSSKNSYAI